MRRADLSVIVIVLALCVCESYGANAQILTNAWASGDGKWEVATNWSLAVPPAATQLVVVGSSVSKTVTIDATTTNFPSTMTISNLVLSTPDTSVNTLFLNNAGTGTPLVVLARLSIEPGGALTINDSALQIGSSLPGILNLDGGMQVNSGGALNGGYFLIGVNATGTVSVTGGTLSVSNLLTSIGFLGVGQMTISNVSLSVGDLTVGNCTQSLMAVSQLTVAGGQLTTGTNFTMIGSSGIGQMTVAGGTSTVASVLICGIDKGAGSVWVTSGQLVATNSDTLIGCSGTGQMTVSNGQFSANALYVGIDPVGFSFITNSSSPPAIGMVTAGFSRGTMTVAGGAVTLNSSLMVGADPGATGAVWITGGQVTVTNDSTVIGSSGIGQLTSSNGTVRLRDADVGMFSGSVGTLAIAGGAAVISSNVVLGDCATNAIGNVVLTDGLLFIDNDAFTATLDVRDGLVSITGGTLYLDNLVMTSACGQFIHSGGDVLIGTMTLDPNLSATGDGIPNGWKLAHGFDPLSTNGVNNANADPDGDGMSNLQEYLAGTDPNDSTSVLRIVVVTPRGNDILITWTAVCGHTNVVQAASDLSGSYSDISSNIVITRSSGATTNYLDAGAVTNGPTRFYRVRLAP